MSFSALLDRTVTVVPTTAGAKDIYGNTTRVTGVPVEDIPARREQVDATEDIVGRDRQTRRYLYFFETNVSIGGRDRIVDTDGTFEVDGEPDVVDGRSGPHHIEALAYRIEG